MRGAGPSPHYRGAMRCAISVGMGGVAERGLTDNGFAARLGSVTRLSEAERGMLARLEEGPLPVKRGEILQRDDERVDALYLMHSGRVMSYIVLEDGTRQITSLYFAGEFVGATAALGELAHETVEAISPAVVSLIDKGALRTLMEAHPRLLALLFMLARDDRVMLTNRLKSIGRQNARQRLAAFLVEVHDRLGLVGMLETDHFNLMLTQEDIADALGLTPVHVNRTMRGLERDGLIERQGRIIRFVDADAMRELGGVSRRYEGVDLNWLAGDD